MQLIKYVFFSILFLGASLANCQTAFNEGMIKMEITEVDADDQNIAAQLEMMKGTETDYSFNKEQSLVTSNMMGGMIVMQSLTKNETEEVTMLFDMMGQKMMVTSTKEEREASEAKQQAGLENIKLEYDEEDKKKILGYDCIRVKAVGENMPFSFEMYVTKDLAIDHKLIQGMQSFDLDGFPLEYVMKMEQMSLTYAATEIITEVDSNVFELSTEGYKKMTFEEFEEQMKGFGGGMGF